MDEDDLYEDAGDLEFFESTPTNQVGSLYLARVPKALWKSWSELDDDAEIQIGTLRQWYDSAPDGTMKPRMKMLLNSDIAQHQTVPREYNLDITSGVDHHFVFTEEDLPGYKAKSKARTDASNNGLPLHILRARAEKVEKPKWDKNKPYYRKAIPKKTKIYGKIAYELNCAPVHAEEQRHLLQAQTSEAFRSGKLQILDRRNGQILLTGTGRAADWDSNFIKSQPKPTKAKKVEMKTIRIPESELMDKIIQCFSRFQYWSLKSLRAELKQPEAYLRQTLEKIAVLNKTGRFANNWSLRPEHAAPHLQTPGDVAPDAVDGDSDVEDDDEVKMEDAL